jgi:acetyl coenzyme A synthetase (ADP forming)-like protein
VTGVYPAHREATVVLRDGSTLSVRPIRREDEAELSRFFTGLSLESRIFRFFAAVANADASVKRMIDVDYAKRYGIIALAGRQHEVVGHAMYVAIEPGKAELALAVADAYQGRGLGTILLGQLAEAASEAGIQVLEAVVRPANHRMLAVLRESGFPIHSRSEPGEIHAELPTQLTREALMRFEDRDRTAAIAAVTHILAPRSVAAIGASRTRGSIGAELFHNLVEGGFTGPIYPVNPAASTIENLPAYSSVLDIKGDVELAVITVPAEAVVGVARDCAAKGVRGVVVISAGFGEVGPEGAERQQTLVRICRESGMRLVGPNCMGVINTSPDLKLNATFAPDKPVRGGIGFLSQSGGLGIAVMARAQALGSGVSSFVSVGNKADISGNDLIQFWESDPETRMIMLYLESFGNPRKFAHIARRVSRSKPILAVKGGRTLAGNRATTSHTGALLSASDVTVDALFQQAGVIRTDTLAELFDTALLIGSQRIPTGNRVAILTNAGGPAILCADACEASGLVVPPLPSEARKALASFLPAAGSTGNPVDMLAAATAADYRQAIDVLAHREEIDAIIVIFTPPLVTQAAEVVEAIQSAASAMPRPIPLLSVFMSKESAPHVVSSHGVSIPYYPFPEDAARALARAARYSSWLQTPEEPITFPDGVDRDRATAVIASNLVQGGGWMAPETVAELLDCYRIPLAETRFAATPSQAAQLARELGPAVALKAVAAAVLHKTDAGGVRLGLKASAVRTAARRMQTAFEKAGHPVERFQLQPMVAPGVEMIVGVVQDQHFGPVLACGAGGTATELLKDVSVRITPIGKGDAERMIRSLKTYPLLDGYRGAPRADVSALVDVLLRVSALVQAHPQVAEMDLNPLIVHEHGAITVDARIRLELAVGHKPLGAR